MGKKVKDKGKSNDVTQTTDADDNLPMYYDRDKGGTIFDKIFLNNKLRVGIVMFLMAVVVPLLVNEYIYKANANGDEYEVWGTCILKPEYRVPCLVGRTFITPNECSSIGCCWNVTTAECHHSIPTKFSYFIEQQSENNMSLTLKTQTDETPFRTPTITKLKYILQPITETHLEIVIKDSNQLIPPFNSTLHIDDTQFSAIIYNSSFSLEISRRIGEDDLKKSSLLLSTSKGPLIASDNYWELTIQLPLDGVVYGFGRLQLKGNYVNLYSSANNTGSHPVIMSVDTLGQAHGIYVDNTGPLEIHFFQDSKLLIIRSLSNEGFNIHLFAGPTPKEVLYQLTELIGRPKLPPYWALGLHICRDTDGITDDYEEILNDFVKFRNVSLLMSLPYDSHCIHEKLLGDLTFNITKDEDLVAVNMALEHIENDGRKFVMTLPLPIAVGENAAYRSAVDKGILVKQSASNQTEYAGEYNGVPVVYPDWTHPDSGEWFGEHFQALQDRLGGSERVAGMVLQDNWPANTKPHAAKEDLVYIPQAFNDSLSNGTLWWQTMHANTKTHHAIHNMYGLLHARQVLKAFNESTPMILSSSTYPGSGVVSGAHHQGSINVPAKWTSLKETLISALGLGLSGLPLASGGPVCGSMSDFNHTQHETLCLKWYLLSITLPLMRVSSVYPYRDPTTFTSGFTRNAVLQALRLRYTLLPYYYTVFQEAVMTGSPVARPMFFEYPEDVLTRHMDEQFMLGSALLVAPILVPGAVNVQVYIPDEDVNWYQFVGGYQVNNGTGRYIVTISTLETEVTILLRGGYIVPTQKANVTAESSRLNSHHIVVGLNCAQSNQCVAKGELFLSDDVSTATLDLIASETNLTISNIQSAQVLCASNGTTQRVSTVVDEVSVYGVTPERFAVHVSEQKTGLSNNAKVEYENRDKVMKIKALALDWCQINEDFITIGWQ